MATENVINTEQKIVMLVSNESVTLTPSIDEAMALILKHYETGDPLIFRSGFESDLKLSSHKILLYDSINALSTGNELLLPAAPQDYGCYKRIQSKPNNGIKELVEKLKEETNHAISE